MSTFRQYLREEMARSKMVAGWGVSGWRGVLWMERVRIGRLTEIDVDKGGFVAGVKKGAGVLAEAGFDEVEGLQDGLSALSKHGHGASQGAQPGADENSLEAHEAMKGLHHIVIVCRNHLPIRALKGILKQKHDVHRFGDDLSIELNGRQ